LLEWKAMGLAVLYPADLEEEFRAETFNSSQVRGSCPLQIAADIGSQNFNSCEVSRQQESTSLPALASGILAMSYPRGQLGYRKT
jgi:hypothetical protein